MALDELSKTAELVVTGAVTLSSSFVGAYLAFLFNKRQQSAALALTRVEAINGAMVILTRQYSLLRNYYDQHLKKNEQSAGRHLKNDALLELRPTHSVVNLPALSFLIETPARDTVLQISMLDATFQTCIDTVNMRSLVHREQYQPALVSVFAEHGNRVAGPVVAAAIGDKLNMTLQRITDDVYSLIHEALPKFESASKSLQTEFKKVFPKHVIVKFEPTSRAEDIADLDALTVPDFRQRPGYR